MNRNVSIVIFILVLVVIAGYLVWLRSRYQPSVLPATDVEEVVVASPKTQASSSATTATPSAHEATGSMKQKTSTSSSAKK